MSRDLSTNNLAEVDAPHLHEIVMAKLEFDVPVYVHSGIGTVAFDGNDYLGVGDFGTITDTNESSFLRPSALVLGLSGIDADLITEALDAGNYGDPVTLYVGYRQDDGTLVDDPWLLWAGFFEFATIGQGAENVITITVQHDLAVLTDNDGSRFTSEEQEVRFPGDVGFAFIVKMNSVKLQWGGGRVWDGGRGIDDPFDGRRTRGDRYLP